MVANNMLGDLESAARKLVPSGILFSPNPTHGSRFRVARS
ncbi:hypothetical protein LINGRAHAP2_LOCUS20259, partial [Linum grandiflorum]